MTKRIIAGLVLLASLSFFPGWITLLLGIVFAFFFPCYIELFLAAAVLDMIWSAPVSRLGGFEHFFAACALLGLLAAEFSRRYLRS